MIMTKMIPMTEMQMIMINIGELMMTMTRMARMVMIMMAYQHIPTRWENVTLWVGI